MKIQKIVSYLCVMMMTVFIVTSCTDELPNKASVKAAITPNVLDAPSATSYVLTFPTREATFNVFKWSAPDFGFSSSITYKLQIDKASGNFSAPQELATVVNNTSVALTNGTINDRLLGLGLATEVAASVKIRVVSIVSDKVDKVISNERTITVTPYPVVFASYYGRGAGLNGWGNWGDGLDDEFVSTEFNVYWTYAYLVNGQTWRLFKIRDWAVGYNYPFFTGGVDADLSNANDGDKNFLNNVTSGWYKVTFNFNTLTVVVDPATEPVMYMVGDGVPAAGWSWNTPVKMKFIAPGIFENSAAVTFDPSAAGKAFRFFGQADWGPTGYAYPYFTSVDARFTNANDGDKNLHPTLAGPFKLRVDINAAVKKVTVLP